MVTSRRYPTPTNVSLSVVDRTKRHVKSKVCKTLQSQNVPRFDVGPISPGSIGRDSIREITPLPGQNQFSHQCFGPWNPTSPDTRSDPTQPTTVARTPHLHTTRQLNSGKRPAQPAAAQVRSHRVPEFAIRVSRPFDRPSVTCPFGVSLYSQTLWVSVDTGSIGASGRTVGPPFSWAAGQLAQPFTWPPRPGHATSATRP